MKIVKMQWVKDEELVIAHNRWVLHWKNPLVCDWSRFLGVTAFPNTTNNHFGILWQLPDEGANRIKMLNGPNWYALLRAMETQYVIGKGL